MIPLTISPAPAISNDGITYETTYGVGAAVVGGGGWFVGVVDPPPQAQHALPASVPIAPYVAKVSPAAHIVGL